MHCEIRNIAVSPEDILYSLENGYTFKRAILVAPCGISQVSVDYKVFYFLKKALQ